MDTSRRSILKMFGITAAAATAGVAVAEDVAAQPPALQNTMALALKPPEGWTYQWKRVFVTKDAPDLENILNMVVHGWKPVPLERHRDQISRADDAFWIEAGGLVLMEKPTADIPAPFEYEPRGITGPIGPCGPLGMRGT
jgi:hypothetical protein